MTSYSLPAGLQMHAEFVYVFVSVFVAVNICVFVFVAVNMFVFVFLAVNISFTFFH